LDRVADITRENGCRRANEWSERTPATRRARSAGSRGGLEVRNPDLAVGEDLVDLGVEGRFHIRDTSGEHERGAPGRRVLHGEPVAREPALESGDVVGRGAETQLELVGREPAVEVRRRGVVLVGEKAREAGRVAPRQDEDHAVEPRLSVQPSEVAGARSLVRHRPGVRGRFAGLCAGAAGAARRIGTRTAIPARDRPDRPRPEKRRPFDILPRTGTLPGTPAALRVILRVS
jgi:hypothetical protein